MENRSWGGRGNLANTLSLSSSCEWISGCQHQSWSTLSSTPEWTWLLVSPQRPRPRPWPHSRSLCLKQNLIQLPGSANLRMWAIWEDWLSRWDAVLYLLYDGLAKKSKHGALCTPDKILGLKKMWKCQSLSCVQLFATPWAIVCQAPLSMELQARILEGVGIPFSRGSSWPKNLSWVSHITGRFLPSEPLGKLLGLKGGLGFC